MDSHVFMLIVIILLLLLITGHIELPRCMQCEGFLDRYRLTGVDHI